MATLFNILAWKIPWTEEPGELQSMGSQSQTGLGMHAGGVYKQTFQPPSVLGIRIFYLFSNIMFENMQRILQTKEEHPSF